LHLDLFEQPVPDGTSFELEALAGITMPLFVVDPERCCRDGVCVAECPTRIIVLRPGDATPHIPTEAEEGCRHCGHCVAVCPSGAITCDGIPSEQLPPVRTDLLLGPEQVTHFLRARRSIRTFTPRLVARETLAALLDVARFAPSASNRQPVTWLIVHDAAEVRRLAGLTVDWMRAICASQPPAAQRNLQRFITGWDSGLDMVCRGAPHLLVACASADYTWAAVDCAIALTYLELAAPPFGLGACWGGIFTNAARQWQPVQEALALPADLAVFGAMLIGYPRYRYDRLPERNAARIVWHGTPAEAPKK
jgi:nitroreductase/NAD-dependent dihydropyrimidine dehydrogenase PreA subunit